MPDEITDSVADYGDVFVSPLPRQRRHTQRLQLAENSLLPNKIGQRGGGADDDEERANKGDDDAEAGVVDFVSSSSRLRILGWGWSAKALRFTRDEDDDGDRNSVS